MHGRDSEGKPGMRFKRICLENFKISNTALLARKLEYAVPLTGVRHTGPCMTLHLKINETKQYVILAR